MGKICQTFREDSEPPPVEVPVIDPTLPSPPMSPTRFIPRAMGSDGVPGTPGSVGLDDEVSMPEIPLQKQFSLPSPGEDGALLNDLTLAAVRRARMLLKFHAAEVTCAARTTIPS